MSDYIKRDGVMMVLGASRTLTEGMRSVLMIPSADVVKVVWCKDCKFWDSGCRWCDLWGDTQEYDDGYCSYGEREEK